ncbi:DUF502 domain-containing protein [Motiliproteus sp. SC1-56]|uniref:DUF502 domain-containing protein n=1 Tax=Motiliproteus sp. SC1-56 TaxID=2799565 RepID=UPI001A8FC1FA|nr:DUF502 domain-containing protein [Motiliproteus sp. SC1-56]
MLSFVSRNILTGLVTILPVALTLYLLFWLATAAEAVLGEMIKLMLPEAYYWPGMGMVAGLGIAFVMGLMMKAYLVQRLFALSEQLLYRMPLVKSIYGAIHDFIDYFSPATKKEFDQVVSVSMGGGEIKLIGFVTQTVEENLPKGLREPDHILVYLPMSYMIGGYTVLMPRSALTPLEISMEEAMRLTLTAGVTGTRAPPVVGSPLFRRPAFFRDKQQSKQNKTP